MKDRAQAEIKKKEQRGIKWGKAHQDEKQRTTEVRKGRGEREISQVYHFNEVSWLPHCFSVLFLTFLWHHSIMPTWKVLLWLPPSQACHGENSELIWKHDPGCERPGMDYGRWVMWFSNVSLKMKECCGVIKTHDIESLFSIYWLTCTLCACRICV